MLRIQENKKGRLRMNTTLMRLLRTVMVAALALLMAHPVRAAPPVSSLPIVDFEHWFPWLGWVSSEGHDAEFPDGFIYKVLSERSNGCHCLCDRLEIKA
jgi:hypothetical protein